jgi:hypothetical protein
MLMCKAMWHKLPACVVCISQAGSLCHAYADESATQPLYRGAEKCSLCHTANPKRPKLDGNKYYALNEYETWSDLDKHSQAYDVLSKSNTTSNQIGRLLGINPQTSNQCLSCHAVACDPKAYSAENFEKIKQGGVSCEVCHGPSSQWCRVHDEPADWRQKLSRKARADAGMIDLRDPVVKADKCLSCHLGNRKEGKFVTHEMFAAGHPPVSGFEVATFLTSMPKHWDSATSLPPEYAHDYPNDDPHAGSMVATRMMAIGGLVALRNYAALIRDEAADRAKPEAAGSAELALYDCAACHHELAQPSWRQKRGYLGRAPGRPRNRAWPIVLAKLRATGAEDEFSNELDALYNALGEKPFGDPAHVCLTADALYRKADRAANALALKKFDKTDAKGLLLRICKLGIEEVPDFESARQLGWALCVVDDDLNPSPDKSPSMKVTRNSIIENLALKIPQGKKLYEATLADTQAATANYEPGNFQKHLQGIESLYKLDSK